MAEWATTRKDRRASLSRQSVWAVTGLVALGERRARSRAEGSIQEGVSKSHRPPAPTGVPRSRSPQARAGRAQQP